MCDILRPHLSVYSLSMVTVILQSYLSAVPIQHLANTLQRGRITTLLSFFPISHQSPDTVYAHFCDYGLVEVAAWQAGTFNGG